MSELMHVIRKRLVRLLLAGGLMTGAVGVPVLLTAGTAEAANPLCSAGAVAAGTPCTLTGTIGLTAGSLTLTAPSALSWSSAITGGNLTLVATQQSYAVNDATGSGSGWHVTAAATTFTNGSSTLPNAGTLVTTGSNSSIASTNAPTGACATGVICLVPSNITAYPVALTTAVTSPTPSTIYDTSALSGLGSMTIGVGANPAGWWVNVPASASVGSYTSTVTMQIISGP